MIPIINYYHSNNVIMIIIIYDKCFLRPAMANTAHLKAVRSTPAMSIEDTSKDYFIIHNEYNYLSILTVGQKPVHARAQIRHWLGKKTSEATGYCKRTVERIIVEKRKLKGGEFTSPEKRYKKSRLRIVVDDFDCHSTYCS